MITLPYSFGGRNASAALVRDALVLPAGGVLAAYYKEQQLQPEREKVTGLANNLTAITMSVLLQGVHKLILPVLAGTAIIIRTFDKKTDEKKISSAVSDSIWLVCGLATQKLLTGRLWQNNSCCTGPMRTFAFLGDVSAFAIGAFLAAPSVDKYVQDEILKPFFQKNAPPEEKEQKDNLTGGYMLPPQTQGYLPSPMPQINKTV